MRQLLEQTFARAMQVLGRQRHQHSLQRQRMCVSCVERGFGQLEAGPTVAHLDWNCVTTSLYNPDGQSYYTNWKVNIMHVPQWVELGYILSMLSRPCN